MAYRNTFFRWLFLYSLTFGLTYVLKLFTYLCPETGQDPVGLKRCKIITSGEKLQPITFWGIQCSVDSTQSAAPV